MDGEEKVIQKNKHVAGNVFPREELIKEIENYLVSKGYAGIRKGSYLADCIADFILARDQKQPAASEDEVKELSNFLLKLPINKCDLSFPGDTKIIADLIIHEGYRKQSPEGKAPNGGYFGTHCHICLDAVGICKCRKQAPEGKCTCGITATEFCPEHGE